MSHASNGREQHCHSAPDGRGARSRAQACARRRAESAQSMTTAGRPTTSSGAATTISSSCWIMCAENSSSDASCSGESSASDEHEHASGERHDLPRSTPRRRRATRARAHRGVARRGQRQRSDDPGSHVQPADQRGVQQRDHARMHGSNTKIASHCARITSAEKTLIANAQDARGSASAWRRCRLRPRRRAPTRFQLRYAANAAPSDDDEAQRRNDVQRAVRSAPARPHVHRIHGLLIDERDDRPEQHAERQAQQPGPARELRDVVAPARTASEDSRADIDDEVDRNPDADGEIPVEAVVARIAERFHRHLLQ